MHVLRRKLSSFLGAGALAAILTMSGVVNVAAASPKNATCAGGSILAGTYKSLTITGQCNLDSGNVTVKNNVTITHGGGLNAAFSGSNLTVGHDLVITSNGLGVVLGCEPHAFPCFNDPNANTGGTTGVQTNHSIRRNLIAKGAILILVHHTAIGGDVTQTGGGGGVQCASIFPNGPPPYTTYEDNTIHGDVTVTGMHTCWSGFFRNTVGGDVTWNNNITWDGTPETTFQDTILHGDEDGNEITTNTIHGDLSCFDNFPAIQFGDSGGIPNVVSGDIEGQCTAVSVHAGEAGE